eukprot:5235448-Amphidinium_carterae.1
MAPPQPYVSEVERPVIAMPIDGLNLQTHSYQVQGTDFEVDRRYEIIEPMSHGAYGTVCSAADT